MHPENETEDNITKTRREAIRRLVSSQAVGTQAELTEKLEALHIPTTQSTVSRDIRALHLVKVTGPNGKYYALPEKSSSGISEEQFASMYRGVSAHADRAMNLVVLHTQQGMAQALCALLDQKQLKGVVGTLAGDDTILLVCRDEAAAQEMIKLFQAFEH